MLGVSDSSSEDECVRAFKAKMSTNHDNGYTPDDIDFPELLSPFTGVKKREATSVIEKVSDSCTDDECAFKAKLSKIDDVRYTPVDNAVNPELVSPFTAIKIREAPSGIGKGLVTVEDPPPVGLVNNNNICFFNSMIQVLWSLQKFREKALSGTHSTWLKNLFSV